MGGGVRCYLFDESGAFFENFLRYNKRSTIFSRDIQTAARLLLIAAIYFSFLKGSGSFPAGSPFVRQAGQACCLIFSHCKSINCKTTVIIVCLISQHERRIML